MRTPAQHLADLLLDQPVETWVHERRGRGMSWRRIALEMRDATEGKVDVSPTTVMAWDTAATERQSA